MVLVIASQCGKTEGLFDAIGRRLDIEPVPIIYLGPSRNMLREQLEPRLDELLTGTVLSRVMASEKFQSKTKKIVNGVQLRLAHGGSSTALKSDPAGLVVTDEADELLSNVRKAGSPIPLIDMRGDTFADFVHAITSTPSEGTAEVEVDPDTGLEFWSESDPEEVASTIWRLWLSGTRYHWAWPCPHCGEYFIPRFACLGWDKPVGPDGREMPSTVQLARRTAHLVCPRNGCIIEDDADGRTKADMNAAGRYVAPGQSVSADGLVLGDEPDSWTLSYWVSGLASPFVSWGERAARYVEAVRSRDPEQIKAVKNGGFGELYSPGGGQVADWTAVRECTDDYRTGETPSGVQLVSLTSDVQQDGLYLTVRGWGVAGTNWLLAHDFLYGDTAEDDVWQSLENVILAGWDGMPIRLSLIDSGFRPGKKFQVPDHKVYMFCRRLRRHGVFATKGSSAPMRRPIVKSVIDINIAGKEMKRGLDLIRLDTDFFKSWVQQRIEWEHGTPGAWYVPDDIDDDYCRQIVSEARIMGPGGKPKWVPRFRDNHFLDCEAMQAACGHLLNVTKIREAERQPSRRPAPPPPEARPPTERSSRPSRGKSWLGQGGSIW